MYERGDIGFTGCTFGKRIDGEKLLINFKI
jgi:hypothetical protein